MAKDLGLERLLELIADRITGDVTRTLRAFLDGELRRIEKRIGGRRGPGRPPARGRRGRPASGRRARRRKGGRAGASSAEIEKRRARALEIVRANAEGIGSVDVARKMKVDARSVGKLLAGLAVKKIVKKDGDLYRPA